ncbi:Polyketide synthase [Pyrenophora tritici-repentis]|nr:Polyketide synthase [Pyrenophora tritici-repentis]KAI2478941.1 Polyketide synthase [Pyrenophora tritici-repentis]
MPNSATQFNSRQRIKTIRHQRLAWLNLRLKTQQQRNLRLENLQCRLDERGVRAARRMLDLESANSLVDSAVAGCRLMATGVTTGTRVEEIVESGLSTSGSWDRPAEDRVSENLTQHIFVDGWLFLRVEPCGKLVAAFHLGNEANVLDDS